MSNNLEAIYAGSKTVARRVVNFDFPKSVSPKTELTLEAALRLTFPNELYPNSFRILPFLVNLIYAANNYFDVGLNARDRYLSRNFSPALHYIYSETRSSLTESRKRLEKLLSEDQYGIIDIFIHNGTVLVDHRLSATPNPCIFRELDSAIYGGMIFPLLIDGFSEKTGMKITKANSYEELLQIYAPFLISQLSEADIKNLANSHLKAVIGMQAIEMMAAYVDDLDAEENAPLSLPTASKEERQEAIIHCRKIAEACGFSSLITKLFPSLAKIHNLKAYLVRRRKETIELEKIEHHPLRSVYLLREWLSAKNILDQY